MNPRHSIIFHHEARRGLQPRRLRFVRSHGIRHCTKRLGRDYKSRPASGVFILFRHIYSHGLVLFNTVRHNRRKPYYTI